MPSTCNFNDVIPTFDIAITRAREFLRNSEESMRRRAFLLTIILIRFAATAWTAASSERPNDSSRAERCVALMNNPPVLQRIAAPSTRNNGETVVLPTEEVFSISHSRFAVSSAASVRSPRVSRARLVNQPSLMVGLLTHERTHEATRNRMGKGKMSNDIRKVFFRN